jgi:predicted MFS family arabinose efflux permease
VAVVWDKPGSRSGGEQPPLWHAALAGLSALLVGIGLSRFGYAPLIPALIQTGWFDTGEASYLGATNLAGYVIGAALAPRLATWSTTTGPMRGSMVLATASFVACAFPLGFWWYFPWRVASGIAGGLLMVLAPPAVLASVRPELRGRVSGIVFTGVGAGIALSGTVVPWAISFGLPGTWLGLGGVSAALTALAWGGLPTMATTRSAPIHPPAWAGARRIPGLLVLIIVYGCAAAGFVPHTVFWVDYIARGLDHGLGVGGAYWVGLGGAAACRPLATGILADRIGFRVSLQLALIGQAVAVALPIASAHSVSLALSSIGVGGLAIGATSLASGRVGELVPLEYRQQVWGWMTIVFAIVYAGTAYVLSYLFVRTGSYDVLFAVGAVALLLGGLLGFASPRHVCRRGK